MKLGEGGEAFFVFETTENIPEAMQTSPLVSPASSPPLEAEGQDPEVSHLSEPDFLDLDTIHGKQRSGSLARSGTNIAESSGRQPSNLGRFRSLHFLCMSSKYKQELNLYYRCFNSTVSLAGSDQTNIWRLDWCSITTRRCSKTPYGRDTASFCSHT